MAAPRLAKRAGRGGLCPPGRSVGLRQLITLCGARATLGDSGLGQEKAMEKSFGIIMLAVLVVVAILGFHYN
jgi:hypothetical protein